MSGRMQNPRARRWKRKFGERVRALRNGAGISQEALADAAAVHRTYIGAVERGEQNVSLVLIHQIADALGVSPGDLFDTGT